MEIKRTTIYISEELHKTIKEFLVDDDEFNTLSEMVSVLLQRYIENKEVLDDSKVAHIEKELKVANHQTRILLQQMTTLLKKQEAVPKDFYKDSYFYKKSVELIESDFRYQKMNPSRPSMRTEQSESADDMFKNIYGTSEDI